MTDFRLSFEELGLPYGSSQEEIRRAYHELTEKLQASLASAPPASQDAWKERLMQVDEAYMTLISAAWQEELDRHNEREAQMNTGQLGLALQKAHEEALQRAGGEEQMSGIWSAAGESSISEARHDALEESLQEAQEEAIRRALAEGDSGLDHESPAATLPYQGVAGPGLRQPASYSRAPTFPRGPVVRWVMAATLALIWLHLTALVPLTRAWTMRKYLAVNLSEMTLEKRHKQLYDEWMSYQVEKLEALRQLLGRKVEYWEADKWRPPYSLEVFTREHRAVPGDSNPSAPEGHMPPGY